MKKEEKEQPLLRQLKLKIKQNTYTIDFPNVGKIIDIETRKAALSSGTYGEMANSGLLHAGIALDLIDVIAYFGVLIPDLMKDLRVDSITDLSPIEAKALVNALKKDFLPWYMRWVNELRKVDEVEEISKTTKENEESKG